MSELGNKHECLGCSTKFYDLGKSELICPQCGENQKDLAAAQESSGSKKTQRRKTSAKAKAKTKAKAKAKGKPKDAKKATADTEDEKETAVADVDKAPNEELADADKKD